MSDDRGGLSIREVNDSFKAAFADAHTLADARSAFDFVYLVYADNNQFKRIFAPSERSLSVTASGRDNTGGFKLIPGGRNPVAGKDADLMLVLAHTGSVDLFIECGELRDFYEFSEEDIARLSEQIENTKAVNREILRENTEALLAAGHEYDEKEEAERRTGGAAAAISPAGSGATSATVTPVSTREAILAARRGEGMAGSGRGGK